MYEGTASRDDSEGAELPTNLQSTVVSLCECQELGSCFEDLVFRVVL